MGTISTDDPLNFSAEESVVISKQRVSDHGEVMTGAREVNAMLDLVKQETERIESRFLEPACGNGNFLAEILERKLRVVESRYAKSQLEYERNAVLAVCSIYGIDILEDNVTACRARLFGIFDWRYTNRFKKTAKNACRDSVPAFQQGGCRVVENVFESRSPRVPPDALESCHNARGDEVAVIGGY